MFLAKKYYLILIVILFISCSSDLLTTKHTPIDYYQSINDSLSSGIDENANEALLDLISNYPKSNLIEPSILALINYYEQKKEFLIARFYLKKYKERSSPEDIDKIEYLKLSMQYQEITSYKRQQVQTRETILKLEDFLLLFEDSIYRYNVATMHSHLVLSENLNYKEIVSLYKKLNKPNASKFYQSKISIQDTSAITKPKINIFKNIFE